MPVYVVNVTMRLLLALATVESSWSAWRSLHYLLAVMLIALALAPGRGLAFDPVDLARSEAELRSALEELGVALGGVAGQERNGLVTDLHLTASDISRTLDRLDDQPLAPVVPELPHDLGFLADIVRTIASDLSAAGAAASSARLDPLLAAAGERLARISGALDDWAGLTGRAVVEVDDQAVATVVRSTDRLVYLAVRYTGITLLLAGLLVLAVQFLRLGEDRVRSLELLRVAPAPSLAAVATFALFFLGALVLSVSPGVLARLSAKVALYPQEHPCERLEAERQRLATAQEIASAGLIEAAKARMRPTARDCLGLTSAVAAAEAVEQIAARNRITLAAAPAAGPLEPPATEVAAVAAPALDTDLRDQPEVPEPDDAADGQVRDALGELLESIRQPEPAAATGADQSDPATSATTLDEASPPNGESMPDDVRLATVEPAAGPATLPSPPAGRERRDYIATTGVNYRTAPSTDAPRLGLLGPGQRVALLGETDGWAEVELADGRQVYIASRFLAPAP